MVEQERINTKVNLWVTTLKENGYRITMPRRVVLESIASSEYAITPIEIYEKSRKRSHRKSC